MLKTLSFWKPLLAEETHSLAQADKVSSCNKKSFLSQKAKKCQLKSLPLKYDDIFSQLFVTVEFTWKEADGEKEF